MNLPAYPAYKPSGTEYLGEIPMHWEIIKNKYIFLLKKKIVGKESRKFKLLSLTLNGIIERDLENPQGKFPAEFDTYQEVSKGDFVFCLFDIEETPRCVGLSEFDGMITGAYTVYNTSQNTNNKYYYYFYLSIDVEKKLKPYYTGLRNTISKDVFGSLKIPLPPLEEQERIAAFLDQKTAQIDNAIALKEQQIALLHERRQALIHRAVTRGIGSLSGVETPDTPLKDSGVEWIGEIPAHWEVLANRAIYTERNEEGIESLPILSVSIHSAVSSEEINDDENIRGKIKIEDKSNYKRVYPGDVVFNMMRAWQGAIGVVKVDGMVSPAYIVAKSGGKILGSYAEYQYRTLIYIQEMNKLSKGITDFRKRLYWNEFKQIHTVLPPLSEQQEIVAEIERFSAQISKAVALKTAEIEQLKSLKISLIDSAVTGKVRV